MHVYLIKLCQARVYSKIWLTVNPVTSFESFILKFSFTRGTFHLTNNNSNYDVVYT